MGELDTKVEFNTPPPTYPLSAESRRTKHETMVQAQQNNELQSLKRKQQCVKNALTTIPMTELDEIDKLEEQLSEIEQKILQVEYDLSTEASLPLSEEEKGEWRMSQKTHSERLTKHKVNQQKAFAIIIGQCAQQLQDKMHNDAQWEAVNKSQKPLELYLLIEQVEMKQTGNKYPPQNLVKNMLAVLMLKQQTNQSNAQWYEKLNTRVDVTESVGIQFDNFPSLWNYCCMEKGWGDYATLLPDKQATIRNESKERLIAYLLIINSSSTSTHQSVNDLS